MVEENEIVLLIFAIGVFIFIRMNYDKLSKLPHSILIYTSFIFFLTSWVFTNLESFIFPDILNVFEHLTQAAGGICLLLWSWKVFIKGDKKNYDNNNY